MNDAIPQAAVRRFDPPGWSVERFAEFWSDLAPRTSRGWSPKTLSAGGPARTNRFAA